ncbi:HTH domain-containing protein [Rhizobium sp. NFR07]|nr:HTH domain-containing protein [Rhizobium sp. NFR07]
MTALELAQELGVSERSVYRDVETLRLLGAPIDGQAGVGFVLRSGFFLPNFAFSPEEMDALILGLEWVQGRADPALAKSSESALAKINSSRTDRPLAADDTPALLAAASVSKRGDPAQVAPLREAIRQLRKVAIRYQDTAGSISERVIWPITIVYFDDVQVLAAWCESRSAFRHFRVDRVRAVTVLEERYPERRPSLMRRWREQDRDWRSFLTVSVGATG